LYLAKAEHFNISLGLCVLQEKIMFDPEPGNAGMGPEPDPLQLGFGGQMEVFEVLFSSNLPLRAQNRI
jgi:hypothetical protein